MERMNPYRDIIATPHPGEVTPSRPNKQKVKFGLAQQGIPYTINKQGEIVAKVFGSNFKTNAYLMYYDKRGRIYKKEGPETVYEWHFDNRNRPEYLSCDRKHGNKLTHIIVEQYVYQSDTNNEYDTAYLNEEGELLCYETYDERINKPLYDQGAPI